MILSDYRILITGVSGLLGNNLAYYYSDKCTVLGLYNSHPITIRGICIEKLDLVSEYNKINMLVNEFNPTVIIHCASLTNIEECEIEKEVTKKVNVIATKGIVDSIYDKNIKLIYISTDAVYDGVKGNHSESDNINPQNYYGVSKYEGEIEALKHSNTLVLRTNIFGWNIQNKKSLGEWILDELNNGRIINCFKDAFFSSIYTFELAKVLVALMRSDLRGVFNCCSQDSCSKYEFAIMLATRFGLNTALINPISIDDFGFKAKRGKNLALNVNKLKKELDYELPTVGQSIGSFYTDFIIGFPKNIYGHVTL